MCAKIEVTEVLELKQIPKFDGHQVLFWTAIVLKTESVKTSPTERILPEAQ